MAKFYKHGYNHEFNYGCNYEFNHGYNHEHAKINNNSFIITALNVIDDKA